MLVDTERVRAVIVSQPTAHELLDLLRTSTTIHNAYLPALEEVTDGYKLAWIAREMHVDASIITWWVQQRRAVPLSRLDDLARTLSTSLDRLVEGSSQFDVARVMYESFAKSPDASTREPEPEIEPVPVIHPGESLTRPALTLSFDGMPMLPSSPAFCTCGHRVR